MKHLAERLARLGDLQDIATSQSIPISFERSLRDREKLPSLRFCQDVPYLRTLCNNRRAHGFVFEFSHANRTRSPSCDQLWKQLLPLYGEASEFPVEVKEAVDSSQAHSCSWMRFSERPSSPSQTRRFSLPSVNSLESSSRTRCAVTRPLFA